MTEEENTGDIGTVSGTFTEAPVKARAARPASKIQIIDDAAAVVADNLTDEDLPKAIEALEYGTYKLRRYWDRSFTKALIEKSQIKFN